MRLTRKFQNSRKLSCALLQHLPNLLQRQGCTDKTKLRMRLAREDFRDIPISKAVAGIQRADRKTHLKPDLLTCFFNPCSEFAGFAYDLHIHEKEHGLLRSIREAVVFLPENLLRMEQVPLK